MQDTFWTIHSCKELLLYVFFSILYKTIIEG